MGRRTAMYITHEDFDEFWKSSFKYNGLKNSERLHKNLANKIDELQDTIKLDDYVCSVKTGKESTRQIVIKFYEYLEKCNRRPQSCLYEKRFYDLPVERQLEIAKFLHTPKSPREIQERFDINEATTRKDLRELEEGITVLGSTIKIEKKKQGRKYFYHTTLHPVFLPLNLTETYALTVYLERVIKDTDANSHIIRDISNRVKAQLSDYALGRLFPDDNIKMIRGIKNDYYNDKLMASQREHFPSYLMKSGQEFKFFWNEKEHAGRICYDHQEQKYRIKLESGDYLDADINEVDFIIDSFTYK
jgi:DNA-binding Lrp family transcriptional regulator